MSSVQNCCNTSSFAVHLHSTNALISADTSNVELMYATGQLRYASELEHTGTQCLIATLEMQLMAHSYDTSIYTVKVGAVAPHMIHL